MEAIYPPAATALVRLTHEVERAFNDTSREFGLTPQQLQVLCVLHAGPVGMGELGRALHLEKSSLTGLVDRCERRGLVVRIRDSCDRRAWRVGLTDEGERLGEQGHQGVVTRLDKLTSRLAPADQARLTDVLTRLAALADE